MDHSRPTLMYSTRQPKVAQLDLAPLGEEHVCRLEVSVQHLQVKGATGAAVNKDSDGCSSSRVQQPGCSLTAVSGLTSDSGGGVRSRRSTHMCRVEVLQPDQHLVANPLHVRHLHTAAARRRSGSRGQCAVCLGVAWVCVVRGSPPTPRRDLGEISARSRLHLGGLSARSRRHLGEVSR